ncbi:hypothetical protein [Alkalibacterium olivapovliticus]|uniref:Lipoprotein n=1 Tax=Alkalibacterium olivapovliticus TaxID=99907 RepID=A0A2T0VTD2_9LACT|nr:hypothetical protein [Alkalibacterium olivapovliticus]PRY74322.1 hypothetical protein CLV38_1442 [Alkalibacterium olivapovliticus]
MKISISKLVVLGFSSFIFLTGCTQEESVDIDSILEEEGTFSFDLMDSPKITFQSEGMKIRNAHSFVAEYPFPFVPEQLYEEYDIVHTEETLRIEVDDIVYELEILGPRLFRDNENDLELSTDIYLLDDEDQTI